MPLIHSNFRIIRLARPFFPICASERTEQSSKRTLSKIGGVCLSFKRSLLPRRCPKSAPAFALPADARVAAPAFAGQSRCDTASLLPVLSIREIRPRGPLPKGRRTQVGVGVDLGSIETRFSCRSALVPCPACRSSPALLAARADPRRVAEPRLSPRLGDSGLARAGPIEACAACSFAGIRAGRGFEAQRRSVAALAVPRATGHRPCRF